MIHDTKKEEQMIPNIGIVTYPKIISICRSVAKSYAGLADFHFINVALKKSVQAVREKVREKERKGLDIIMAGPGNYSILKSLVSIPVIPFFTTTRALIDAINQAKKYTSDIAMILSSEEKYDLPFLESLLDVRLKPFYANNIEEYRSLCLMAKNDGFKIIIGGSYTVDIAESIGIKGIFSYNQESIFHQAIDKALKLFEYNIHLAKQKSQLNILLQNTSDPLFIIDKNHYITWLNTAAEKKFNIISSDILGKLFQKIFKQVPNDSLDSDESKETIIFHNGESVVLNFHPIRVKNRTDGMVAMGLLASEIEEKDKKIRQHIYKKGFNAKFTFKDFIGSTPVFRDCLKKAKKYAQFDSPILLYGETGTGKEIFAQAIHNQSSRKKYPFVAINCATLPGELIESELFGYEKGAFTGAHKDGKKGLIEIAHRGTLFLDEVSSLAYSLQAKLLRLIQEKEFIRIGGDKVIPVNIRIISASNINLWDAIHSEKFRNDLYYRLNTLYLELPSLRQRQDDILELFIHFVKNRNSMVADAVLDCSELLSKELINCSFYGNIRELQSIAERFSIMVELDQLDHPDHLVKVLKDSLFDAYMNSDQTNQATADSINVCFQNDLKSSIKEAEKAFIKTAASQSRRNRSELAEKLGIKRETLWRKLKEYNIHI